MAGPPLWGLSLVVAGLAANDLWVTSLRSLNTVCRERGREVGREGGKTMSSLQRERRGREGRLCTDSAWRKECQTCSGCSNQQPPGF